MTALSKKVKIGNIIVGGGEPIKIQSMTTTRLSDISSSVKSALDLEKAGCEIVRFSVLDENDAKSIALVKKSLSIPLVADIHFDYRLALSSIENGADKIRINPGNIGSDDKVRKVAEALKRTGVPVRVGSNTGSIEKEFLDKYGRTEKALAESALKHVSTLEKHGVENIVISVKASSVPLRVKAYRYIAERTNYPLHLGVTEAGTEYNGIIKNSLGIGALLLDGIGDTIRVSLSADPVREVVAAKAILKGLDLIKGGAEVIACPTCGRCEWDCMAFAKKTEDYLGGVTKPIKVAVMGCVVNGPGEASDADVGIAGSKDKAVIFVGGKILKTVNLEDAEREFFSEIDKCIR